MKARFLFTTFDGGGNVSPILNAISALLARGHDVRVMSDECTRREIEGVGARFLGWRTAPNKARRARELDPPDWQFSTVDGMRMMSEFFIGGLGGTYATDTLDELQREPADLVVNFDMLLGVIAACESCGQKLALLSTCISLFPMEGMPSFASEMCPPGNEQQSQALAERERQLQQAFDAGLPAFNSLRQSLSLPPLDHLLDQGRAARRWFIGTAAAFDFPIRQLPAHARYVGPLLRDPSWVDLWRSPWPAGDSRLLVVAAFSTSFQNHAECLQRVIDACADLPVRLLVTLGGSIRPDELHATANCLIIDSAPHGIVMREAAAVVTHGGHGTLMTALALGVPVVVLPHGRDQGDNAARVQWHEAGLAMDRGASVAELRDSIGRILGDARLRAGAHRLGALIREEIKHSALVDELEALAAEA